ncbi:hypothetical protein [Acinetobacter baumannii]|uniref:hypothetical protein n=1 Tax=Acinetobacter baumannii TaxID=470 RepID=UPI0035A5B1EF
MDKFEEVWKENRHVWESTKNLAKAMYLAGEEAQQSKVEELKATIKGNHGRIAELERLNQVKAQTILDLHQEITELKASHHGEVIGHEVHFKKIKQERDELQKRVDKAIRLLVEAELYQSEPSIDLAVKALKGEGQ